MTWFREWGSFWKGLSITFKDISNSSNFKFRENSIQGYFIRGKRVRGKCVQGIFVRGKHILPDCDSPLKLTNHHKLLILPKSVIQVSNRHDMVLYYNGSQHLIVGDPPNRIKHNLATRILLKYYYNTDFGDPKVSACDSKMGRDPPVEKHCSIIF